MSTINGTFADDILSGTSGDDVIHGDAGNDRIDGGSGSNIWDLLYGEDGDDILIGSPGRDHISGGAGDDWIDGGGGTSDQLYGDDGNDTFVFPSGSSTWIVDGGTGIDTVVLDEMWYPTTNISSGGAPGQVHVSGLSLKDVEYVKFLNKTVAVFGPYFVTANWVFAPKSTSLGLLSKLVYYEADLSGPVTQWQLFDGNSDPNSGHFVVNGVVQAARTVITITAAEAANTFFVTGTVNDQLQIRAFDGTHWSAPDDELWQPFTLLVRGNHVPMLTPASINATPGQSYALSSLFSITDDEGDAITKYQLFDASPDPASGYLVVNGVARPAETVIELTPKELAQAYFVAGTDFDSLLIRALDGYEWNATRVPGVTAPMGNRYWGSIGFTPPNPAVNHAPVVTGSVARVAANTVLPLLSLFSVSDAEGDAITRYRFSDWSLTDPGGGYFLLNGVGEFQYGDFDLSAAEAAQISLVTGTKKNYVSVEVFDGTSWSSLDLSASFIEAGPIADRVPVVTTADITRTRSQSLPLSSLFSVSDQDGDPITAYQFIDLTADATSGYFLINGQVQAANTVIDVTAAEMSQSFFVTGPAGDRLTIRAFGGFGWSAGEYPNVWAPFDVTVPNARPVVIAANVTKERSQSYAASSLIAGSDPDGDSILAYQLLDATGDPNSGYFLVNGQVQPNGTIINVTAAQLSQVVFATGTIADHLGASAYDGITYGSWTDFDVAVTEAAPIVTVADVTKPSFQSYALSSLFSVSDADGDAITAYQLWDANPDPNSGYFAINNVAQPAQITINVTAAQLAQTKFVTGSVDDYLSIRAFDGAQWSAPDGGPWTSFTVLIQNTPPVPPPAMAMSGDFGGDGKSDILWRQPDGTILIWQMNAGGGLASVSNFGVVDPNLWSIPSVADYNGDGKADVLLRKSDGTIANWLLNGGAIVGANILGNLDGSWSVRGSSDFGGDGRSDVLWQKSDGTINIWEMTPSGGLGKVSNFGVVDPNLWSIPGVADYNGDGKVDVLLRKSDGTIANWLLNGGAIVGANILGIMDGSWSVRGSGDFGGDGKADILWQKSDGTVVIWQMNAAGGLGSVANFGVVDPNAWSFPAIADYNGDGKADILLRKSDGTIANWLMNGGAIAGSNMLGVMGGPQAAKPTAKDFGGDGKADILWRQSDGTLLLWQMNASGGLGTTTNLGVVTSTLIGYGDFNGDAKTDILFRDVGGVVSEWLMNGAAMASSNTLGTMDSSWSVKGTGDFGGNGTADILWQKSDGTVLIWQMNGAGGTASSSSLGAVGSDWALSSVADYNGNGKADILLRNSDGAVYNWLMDGANVAGSNFLGNMDGSWSVKGTGDFGGDGTADLLWQKLDGTVLIWQMNGAGGVASSTNLGVISPAAWSFAAVADYNGDGKADILLRNASGSVANWLMNGASIIGSNTLGAMNNSWTAVTR